MGPNQSKIKTYFRYAIQKFSDNVNYNLLISINNTLDIK